MENKNKKNRVLVQQKSISKRIVIVLWILSLAAVMPAMGATYYGVVEAFSGISPNRSGLKTIANLFSLLGKVAGTINYSDELQKFGSYIKTSVEQFKIEKLHQSGFLVPASDGFKDIIIQGRNREKDYHVSLNKKGFSLSMLRERGDLLFRLRLKESRVVDEDGEQHRSFIMGNEILLDLKDTNQKAVARFFEGFLKVLDPLNLARLPDGQPASFGYLNGYNRRIAYQFSQMLPDASRFSDKYLRLRRFVRTITADGAPYDAINGLIEVDIKALTQDYPDLAKTVNNFLTKMVMDIKLTNLKGETIVHMYSGRPDTPVFGIRFMTKDGKLIPFTERGMPVPSGAISFTETDSLKYILKINMIQRWAGVTIEMLDLQFSGAYRGSDTGSVFYHKLTSPPITRIHGWFLYFIPVFPMEINPVSFAPLFTRVLLEGNEGKGASFYINAGNEQDARGYWHVAGSAELVDNFFLSFMIRSFTSFMPGKEARADIRRFLVDYSRLVVQDLKRQ